MDADKDGQKDFRGSSDNGSTPVLRAGGQDSIPCSSISVVIMNKERKIWDTNRTVSRRAKRTKYWCWGCDRCLVAPGQKCPECGHRPEQKRDKKNG